MYLSLCAVSNHIRRFKRPEYIAHRDFTPLEFLPDDCLLKDYDVPLPWKDGTPASALLDLPLVPGIRINLSWKPHEPLLQAPAARLPTASRCALVSSARASSARCTSPRCRASPACTSSASPISRPTARGANLARVGWPAKQSAGPRRSTRRCAPAPRTWARIGRRSCAHPTIDVVVECTGHPISAVDHCLEAFRHGKHVVNVTVEADAFCGALLARRAAEAGVVYSLAFGDQPA